MGLSRYRLAWIQDIERVERALDGAHDVDCLAVLLHERIELVHAHAMLAGAGATHADRALRYARRKILRLLALIGLVGVEQHDEMEIAVPDVSDDRRDESRARDITLRFHDAIGKAGNGHASVRRECLHAR